jgi:predicted nucleic acid-binding protein
MTDEILLDSNILVYAVDNTDRKKHEIAKEILEDGLRGQKIAISLQNLAEFFITSTRKIKNPLTPKEALETIQLLIELNDFKKISLKEQTLIKAIELSSQAPFWDAMIAATMLENGISQIYTENTKDFQIPGITPINPFA